jgi:hypothetical protein
MSSILVEQMMCQEGFTCIQGDYKDFSVMGTRNLTFYQTLDLFQRLLGHTFYNRVLIRAKVNHNLKGIEVYG